MFNVYNYLLAGGYGLFVLFDAFAPARRFPAMRWWRLRGVVSAVLYIALASYSPYLWMGWLDGFTLIDASSLPLLLAVPLGYAALQLCQYGWHVALHKSDFLWRTFHQMHHSAERLDVYGSLYFHPFDMVGFTFSSSFALTVVAGIDPFAAAVVGVLAGLVSMFSHANLRTPHWLGYLIARPEVHARHHERGRHTGNFGELMIWDQLFGTFDNPRTWQGEAGFYDGASERVVDMLLFRDISDAGTGACNEDERPARAA